MFNFVTEIILISLYCSLVPSCTDSGGLDPDNKHCCSGHVVILSRGQTEDQILQPKPIQGLHDQLGPHVCFR